MQKKYSLEEQKKKMLILSEQGRSSEYCYLRDKDEGQRTLTEKALIEKAKSSSKRANLNVGGVKHEVMWRMLDQVPTSRLGKLAAATTHNQILDLCADYSFEENEYFFDRHPRSFNTILSFYRTGKLHIQDGICHLAFCEDLTYWQLDELCVESCCAEKYVNRKEEIQMQMEAEAGHLKKEDLEIFSSGFLGKLQRMLWDTMEKPEVSRPAKLVSITSLVFVVISTTAMCLTTLPALQGVDVDGNPTENMVLAILETISVVWFTIEYFLRFIGCPEKWRFLKSTMNALDVAAVLPFYVPLIIATVEKYQTNYNHSDDSFATLVTNSWEIPSPKDLHGPWQTQAALSDVMFTTPIDMTPTVQIPGTTGNSVPASSIDDILQVFKIFKLIRLAKIARHSTGLQAIGVTLGNSYKELGLLLMLIVIAGLLFSSLIYFIEVGEEDTEFYSIPNAFWWSVITMTTVGYGDMQPTTGLGKLVGTMCAVSGVLVMSLPIPIIVSNFEAFYANTKKVEASKVRKARLRDEKQAEYEDRVRELLEDKSETMLNISQNNYALKSDRKVSGVENHGNNDNDGEGSDLNETMSEDCALLPGRQQFSPHTPCHTQSLADLF